MTDEGLLLTLGRGEKNALIYTKAVFNPFQTFQTLDGESVSLLEFVQHVDALESRLINPQALGMLKHLMLGYLASTYDKPFIAKGKTPVAKEDARAGLTELIKFLSSYHALVKSFLDNKIWDEHNRDSIAKQFKENLAVIHAYLVDKDYVSESR
ncbi:hypothetical protein [Streptomyces anandii]|uniref:hypothetical protein n=1 Tax=Streptomyces anandii TaxID=285454 RepID=UPI0036937197